MPGLLTDRLRDPLQPKAHGLRQSVVALAVRVGRLLCHQPQSNVIDGPTYQECPFVFVLVRRLSAKSHIVLVDSSPRPSFESLPQLARVGLRLTILIPQVRTVRFSSNDLPGNILEQYCQAAWHIFLEAVQGIQCEFVADRIEVC